MTFVKLSQALESEKQICLPTAICTGKMTKLLLIIFYRGFMKVILGVLSLLSC